MGLCQSRTRQQDGMVQAASWVPGQLPSHVPAAARLCARLDQAADVPQAPFPVWLAGELAKVDAVLTSEKQRAGQMERCQLYSGLHPAAPGNKQTPTAWHGAAEGALHGKPELSTSSEWPKAMA